MKKAKGLEYNYSTWNCEISDEPLLTLVFVQTQSYITDIIGYPVRTNISGTKILIHAILDNSLDELNLNRYPITYFKL